eukprot:TRINITY_DN84231_c0_g1_i1.p1 TRINITY_DN84231_c0_g1~~TRINITY_DN84231_c0_g1_i1.p1  ORF type:complete len:1167 (-),score=173.42 TRINITY_DN84231_c0_g1_i1:268-3306(-)
MQILDEDTAATKVQAAYRGHSARRRVESKKAAQQLHEAIEEGQESLALKTHAIDGSAQRGGSGQCTPPGEGEEPMEAYEVASGVQIIDAQGVLGSGVSVAGPPPPPGMQHVVTKDGTIVTAPATFRKDGTGGHAAPGTTPGASILPPGLTIYTTYLQSNRKEWDNCGRLRHLFSSHKLEFGEIDVAQNALITRNTLAKRSMCNELPQIFFGDTFVGTYDSVAEWNENGKLREELASSGYGSPQTITTVHTVAPGSAGHPAGAQQGGKAAPKGRPDDSWIKHRTEPEAQERHDTPDDSRASSRYSRKSDIVEERADTPPEVDPLDKEIEGATHWVTALNDNIKEERKWHGYFTTVISRLLSRDPTLRTELGTHAAILIQCMIRRWKARKETRAKLSRRNTMFEQEEQEDAAMRVQAMVRIWKARRIVAAKRKEYWEKRMPAALKIQTFARSVLSRRIYSEKRFARLSAAVIRIQCMVRNHQARKEFTRRYSGWKERRTAQLLEENQVADAITIQNLVRKWLARRKAAKTKKEKYGDRDLLQSIKLNMENLLGDDAATDDAFFGPASARSPESKALFMKWSDDTIFERELMKHIEAGEAQKRSKIEALEHHGRAELALYHSGGIFHLEGQEAKDRKRSYMEEDAVRTVMADLEKKERIKVLEDANSRYVRLQQTKEQAVKLVEDEAEARRTLLDLWKLHTKKFGVQFMWGILKIGTSRLEVGESAARKHAVEDEAEAREKLQSFIVNELRVVAWAATQAPQWIVQREEVAKEERYQRVLIEEEDDDIRWRLRTREKEEANTIGRARNFNPNPKSAWATPQQKSDPLNIASLMLDEEKARDHLIWTWFWGHQRLTEWNEGQLKFLNPNQRLSGMNSPPIGFGGRSAMLPDKFNVTGGAATGVPFDLQGELQALQMREMQDRIMMAELQERDREKTHAGMRRSLRHKIQVARNMDSSLSASTPTKGKTVEGAAAADVAVVPDEEAWRRKQVATEEQQDRLRLVDAKLNENPAINAH